MKRRAGEVRLWIQYFCTSARSIFCNGELLKLKVGEHHRRKRDKGSQSSKLFRLKTEGQDKLTNNANDNFQKIWHGVIELLGSNWQKSSHQKLMRSQGNCKKRITKTQDNLMMQWANPKSKHVEKLVPLQMLLVTCADSLASEARPYDPQPWHHCLHHRSPGWGQLCHNLDWTTFSSLSSKTSFRGFPII